MVFGQAGSQMLALFLYRFQVLALPTGQFFLVLDTLHCTLSMSPEGAGSIQVPPHWVLIWSFFPIIEMYSGHFLEHSSSICSKFPTTHWVPGTSRDRFKIVSHGGSACSPEFCFLMTSRWCSGRTLAREFFIYGPKCLPSSLFFFFLPLLKMSVTESRVQISWSCLSYAKALVTWSLPVSVKGELPVPHWPLQDGLQIFSCSAL